MRCPDCNKFVSYDEPECEVNSVELNDTNLDVSVRVVLKCADCGTELKDNEFSTQTDFTHECKPEKERDKEWEPDPDYDPKDKDAEQFSLEEDGEPESTDRMQTHDRRGKLIRNSRYMKHYYGYSLESSIKCRACGEVFGVQTKDEEQASGFNELT